MNIKAPISTNDPDRIFSLMVSPEHGVAPFRFPRETTPIGTWRCYIPKADAPCISTDRSMATVLSAGLQKLERLKAGWNGYNAIPANSDSLRVAKALVPKLSRLIDVVARVGIDDEGDVYFRFTTPDGDAFLTIEAARLHLICLYADRTKNTRADDVPFDGQKLPADIASMLATFGQKTTWPPPR